MAQHASMRISSSMAYTSFVRVGRAGATYSQAGCGFLPRQKLLSVHVAFRSMLTLWSSLSSCKRACIPPCCKTKSRHLVESPAMLPKAHTACSRTSSTGERRRSMKIGTAPQLMTTCVCSEVPEAMLVRAQAASNWIML